MNDFIFETKRRPEELIEIIVRLTIFMVAFSSQSSCNDIVNRGYNVIEIVTRIQIGFEPTALLKRVEIYI